MTKQVSDRDIILDILLQVNEEDEYTHIVLRNALKKYQYLDKVNRAFITRVVKGTIERQLTLDYYLNSVSTVSVAKMKPVIRNILRMSVYQIMYMDNVPESAACNEAVKIAVKRGFKTLKGFVNGVLRNIARNASTMTFPDENKDKIAYLSVKYSTPTWIVADWLADYDYDTVIKMLSSAFEERPLTIRCNTTKTTLENLVNILKTEGVNVEPAPYVKNALVISGYDYLEGLESFNDGLFQIQDVSSMMVGQIANPSEDDYVIDLCAAPGGKSLHVAELLDGTGYVEARDITDYKVSLIKENIERLGLVNIAAVVKDATVVDELSLNKANIVLADLPCSGLGIISKKPDVKYQTTQAKQDELVKLQREILSVAAGYVKPGGRLIYSTCTVNSHENIRNAEWFKENFPFALENINPYIPAELQDENTEKGYLQLLPGKHKCDGFFIARFKRI